MPGDETDQTGRTRDQFGADHRAVLDVMLVESQPDDIPVLQQLADAGQEVAVVAQVGVRRVCSRNDCRELVIEQDQRAAALNRMENPRQVQDAIRRLMRS